MSAPSDEIPKADAIALFHQELRVRNLSILFWSGWIFNIAYVAWTVFDYYLAPSQWTYFLGLRVIAAAINTLIVVAVHRPRFRRYTWEAFWVWLAVFGVFITPMLPAVSDNFSPYVLGFTLIIYGAGLLPFWPPKWALTNVLFIVAAALVALSVWSPLVPFDDLLAGGFFVMTGVGFCFVMAFFKYELAKRDFMTRLELAKTTSDLGEALSKLKELDRLKSKFFANISHELRTPLTLILAPVEELARTAASARDEERLRIIHRNAERLLRLIDDLLDLSKADVGGLRLNLADIDIRSVVATVYENSRPTAAARSIELALSVDDVGEIRGDPHRLEIIVTNLLGNALKYTPDGGRITLRVHQSNDGVVVEVTDTGPGIPAGDLAQVFERFFQASHSNRRRGGGGVGIGLSLAKELVELHGGQIGVTSDVGEGSTFFFTIPYGDGHIHPDAIERRKSLRPAQSYRRVEDAAPLADPPQNASEPEAAVAFGDRGGRILLAEDQRELREFIESLLTQDFEVITAKDGDEAWELVQSQQPDLVISDVMMPGRLGTALCASIKADPVLRQIPVILLTAKVGSEATLEGYAHGADDFVAKPFHPLVLLARVHAQFRLRKLAAALAEREKLAAVGTLAAGILHEVRNPVNAIVNAGRVLALGTTKPETSKKLASVIEDGAQRIQKITDALNTHVRPTEAEVAGPFDLCAGIEATLALLEHRLGSVTVHREFETSCQANVLGGQLNQVFINLLDNSILSGASNVWLTVNSRDDQVYVRIADDGPGVPREIASRVFNPFFTTRRTGEGTGLGLYLCKQFVEQNHGTIQLADREGGGAEFLINVPAYK